jgi:hypothetical protein
MSYQDFHSLHLALVKLGRDKVEQLPFWEDHVTVMGMVFEGTVLLGRHVVLSHFLSGDV